MSSVGSTEKRSKSYMMENMAQEEGPVLLINPSKIEVNILIEKTATSKWQGYLHKHNSKINNDTAKIST